MKILFTISLLLLSGILLAQSAATSDTDIDERLYKTYDQNYLLNLQENHPVLLLRLHFYLDNAWYITEYPAEKTRTDFPTVTIADLRNVNIFQLEKEQQLKRDPEKQVIYQISNTNKVLVYHSAKRFNTAFNQSRQKATD